MHQSLGMLRSAASQSGISDNDANHLSRADPRERTRLYRQDSMRTH